jgi:pyruvate/2-oxoglutarate dehydrogenase complex dihydrolipoamide dehydrogenase (E3) component
MFSSQSSYVLEPLQVGITFGSPNGKQEWSGSHLLVALGRAPVVKELGLPAAGVETTATGFIKVNDRLETNVAGIWAIGDVSGGPQFTHASLDDFRILRDNVFANGSRPEMIVICLPRFLQILNWRMSA